MNPDIGDAADGGVGHSIAAVFLDAQRLSPLEIRVKETELPILSVFVEQQCDGVCFHDIKDAARLEEMGDHLRPAFEVRQPAQYAVGSEDYIELACEVLRQVVEVTLDK